MKILKQWVSKEEFAKIQGGNWTPSPHTHVKVDITDTPWAWADVLKTGSNLTDLATRQHAGLTDVTANQHHPQSHTLASHSTKPHSALTDVTHSQHHNKTHALTGVTHTAAGLTIGWVIKATGATTFAWGQLPHDKLGGLGDDDHTQYHNNTRGDARYYTKTQLQTSGQAAVHWENIINEPTAYVPEHHFHVGKDIISHHLTDLNDERDPPGDPFDVLSTGNIHGQGNYDWWDTWKTSADADCSTQIAVLAGDDKYLTLIDGNAAGKARTTLIVAADHPMITGIVEFEIRQSSNAKLGWFRLMRDAENPINIKMDIDGDMKFYIAGALYDIQAYAANEWYKIRIHFDCVSRAAVLFVDNVFSMRKGLSTTFHGDFINKIRIETDPGDTGYTLDINNLKVFNLTI